MWMVRELIWSKGRHGSWGNGTECDVPVKPMDTGMGGAATQEPQLQAAAESGSTGTLQVVGCW
jgi:hypothetical protein